MIDKQQIEHWVKKKIITRAQANQMLKTQIKEKNKFIQIISIIGAVLIFVGFAWLIARNWHQIADFVKLLILVAVTTGAFASGVILKEKKHIGPGRALIALGALLYILSLFLISQIYHLATTEQHYAWILLAAWTVIIATAYLLKSKENLLIGMITFFPWVLMQYHASINLLENTDQNFIFGLVVIFLGAGVALFGLYSYHKAKKHSFTGMYQFWTVFYFLALLYVMSFQSLIPLLSEYILEQAFSWFLIFFIVACCALLVVGIIANNHHPKTVKEVAGFMTLILVLLLLLLATKATQGQVGYCDAKYCYSYDTEESCNAQHRGYYCEWEGNFCKELGCYEYMSEATCLAAPEYLNCTWEGEYCAGKQMHDFRNTNHELCRISSNNGEACKQNPECEWRPGILHVGDTSNIPTSIWLLWIINNVVFIGFILLVIWYGQRVKSSNIINLALIAFVLDIITRYIGFWSDFRGYFAFSILAILGGVLLLVCAWLIPKWQKKLVQEAKPKRRN